MKIALVHDFLMQDGGAEKVLEALQEAFPEAPTFTLFYDKTRVPQFAKKDIRTSFLERFPFWKQKYQWYLPLMPTATESYDLHAYDVVISSTSAFAKGILTREDAVHICYCHTPTRFLWTDSKSYIKELRLPGFVKALLLPLMTWLRVWDHTAAHRVDKFVANSKTVEQRIKKFYNRPADVIHPPVDIQTFHPVSGERKAFLSGGRLVPYKRIDLVIEAANRTGLPLIVFGTGPEEAALKAKAKSNVTFVGKVSDEKLAELYASSLAFIHPQEEDFGITPVEAMACGTPVIAYKKGGATETVIDGVTGLFFDEPSWEALADAMIRFRAEQFDATAIRTHAETFSRERFIKEIRAYVDASTCS
ncbi:glycosyltransferase [Patescibacteria group bacterium]|nr:glycosyltransferase [Patescibacteria group bacterium]